MAQTFNPNFSGIVGGLVGIVVVLAASAYMYLVMAHVPAQPVPAHKYSTAVISNELTAPDATNVFLKAAAVAPIPPGNGTDTTYKPSDLGKTDITQLGK